MDINSDCVDGCVTSCPPSANSCVLPSHSQGLGDTFIPKTTKLCSQDEPALPRAQSWIQPWKSRHEKVSGSMSTWAPDLPAVPTGSARKHWNSGDGLPMEERRTLPNSCLYIRHISVMEQQQLFGTQRIYHSSTDTPWLLPAPFNVSPPCFFTLLNVCLLSSTCLLPNTFRFVLNILIMAVIRFHPKSLLQYWDLCTNFTVWGDQREEGCLGKALPLQSWAVEINLWCDQGKMWLRPWAAVKRTFPGLCTQSKRLKRSSSIN